MSTELQLMSLIIFVLCVYIFYLRARLLLLVALMNKSSILLKSTTNRLKETNHSYLVLIEKFLPNDEKVTLAFEEYKTAYFDHQKETEPINIEIRFHHLKVANKKFEKACEEYYEQ